MIKIKIFEFNPIQVNTYILYDDTMECVIIDPGCYGVTEEDVLKNFIDSEKLKPVKVINTHAHTDHILGNHFVIENYNVGLEIHKGGDYFIKNAASWAEMLGFHIDIVDQPTKYLEDNDIITFGNSELEVAFTPGHADGSICLISRKDKFVISGDVLFSGSVGRTDLPTGNFELLEKSIKEKLYTLDDDYTVYPGHGPSTTIGTEKHSNPFVSA